MKNRLYLISALLLVLAIGFSCNKGPYPGYEKTDTGLYYKITRGDSEKSLPVEGDVLTVEMQYYLADNDSLLFDSRESQQPIMLPVQKALFGGDINEGLFMITEGDSASFIVKADSFMIYNVNINTLPDFVKPESMFRFEIKVIAHKTNAEYMAEMEEYMAAENARFEELKKQEVIDREAWLKENNINVKPTASGMYFIRKQAGNGPLVEAGDLVKAHYTGYFLSGEVFDSSVDSPQPFSFVAGAGEVIPGWDEAVLMMRKGEKARIILPSELAYGQSDPSIPIPPFATLYFDIEIVDMEKSTRK